MGNLDFCPAFALATVRTWIIHLVWSFFHWCNLETRPEILKDLKLNWAELTACSRKEARSWILAWSEMCGDLGEEAGIRIALDSCLRQHQVSWTQEWIDCLNSSRSVTVSFSHKQSRSTMNICWFENIFLMLIFISLKPFGTFKWMSPRTTHTTQGGEGRMGGRTPLSTVWNHHPQPSVVDRSSQNRLACRN